jgi:hypothetical protein
VKYVVRNVNDSVWLATLTPRLSYTRIVSQAMVVDRQQGAELVTHLRWSEKKTFLLEEATNATS